MRKFLGLLLTVIFVLSAVQAVHSLGVIGTIFVGVNPAFVAYDSGKGEVFVANYGSNTVSVISDSTNSVVATVNVGTEPSAEAYDSTDGEIFVANYASNSVSVISDASDTVVANVTVGSAPYGVAYDSGKSEVFVTNWGSSSVSVISTSSDNVTRTITTEANPHGAAYDSAKGEIFITNQSPSNVSVISDATNAVVATVPVQEGPSGVAYDSGKGEIFATNYGSASVSVISDNTNSVVATVPVGNNPDGVAYDSGENDVFVANWNIGTVSVIADSTNSVFVNVSVGSVPSSVAYDSGKDEIFVSNSGSDTVSVIARTSTSTSISSPTSAVAGSIVNLTATVSGSAPTGNVTWTTSSLGGIFSQPVCVLTNGTCATTYTDNFSGSITIAAYYLGDASNAPSIGSTTLLLTSSTTVVYSQNYTSVQAAINAAPTGATVVIAPGFYKESLTVNEKLTIIGEKDVPVFSGGTSSIFLTLSSGASGSLVTGIEITNYAEGILVQNASNCSIYGNQLCSVGGCGIVLLGGQATGTLIADNTFQDTPTPVNVTSSATGSIIYGNIFSSQTTLTLSVGTNGNSLYQNAVSASQIILNMTSTANNLVYDNSFQASSQITVLTTGKNQWNTTAAGNYWSDYTAKYPDASQVDNSGVWNTPYVIDSNNKDNYPLINPWTPTPGHDIAVLSLVAAKTVISLGYSGNFTVTIADEGLYSESVSLTIYANTTTIYTSQANSLGSAGQQTLQFKWNTTGLAYGNYTVSAWAWPVPSETDVADNNFTLGVIKVTIPGDINGDFTVNLSDLVLLAKAYNTSPGNPKWNPNADFNNDGRVDLSDLTLMAKHYNQSIP